VSSPGHTLGVAGALLGIAAGAVQWAVGDEIGDWTGNKLHPVQLGIITIVLSGVALACVQYLARRREVPDRNRWAAAFLIVAVAGVCFTTVGRLWFVPGPLLLISAALLVRAPGRR
jgi:hypothetical protein